MVQQQTRSPLAAWFQSECRDEAHPDPKPRVYRVNRFLQPSEPRWFQVRALNGKGASAPAVTKWVRTAKPEAVSTPEPVSSPAPAPPPEPAKPAAPIS